MTRPIPVTNSDLIALATGIGQSVSDAQDFADRIQRSYVEPIANGAHLVRELTVASRNFSELSLMIQARMRLQDRDAELAELRRGIG